MEVLNSCSSYSSSCDSTKPSPSESSSVNLSLSLTFPSSCPQREAREDWPPIKPLLRDKLKGRRLLHHCGDDTSLFVKVYMEGVPIGRKLNLCAFSGYNGLLENLSKMFDTSIICGNRDRKHHVLTYEDMDGDWMMVGDIPWENREKTKDHETREMLKYGWCPILHGSGCSQFERMRELGNDGG